MSDKTLMNRGDQVLYKVYNRFPVAFDHGKGVKLYDTEGEEYLDFGAGIAVMSLGYEDLEYTKAIRRVTYSESRLTTVPTTPPMVIT